MKALENSKSLRMEANDLIHTNGLDEVLRKFGDVFYTGSYYLDVMAWPDLDVEIVLNSESIDLDLFFEMGKALAKLPNVTSMKFNNNIDFRIIDTMPVGYYWKLIVDRGAENKPWKVDLWAIDSNDFEEHMRNMKKILDDITDESRKTIIKLKHALLTKDGRTPAFGGYYIYQAVLYENLSELDDVVEYLRVKGINV